MDGSYRLPVLPHRPRIALRKAAIPRAFFAALPSAVWSEEALQQFRPFHLEEHLGNALFPLRNWHQSLSERVFSPTDDDCEKLLVIGAAVRAHACTLAFNRIEAPQLKSERNHCTLRALGTPKAFLSLLRNMQEQLRLGGYPQIATGVTPHITLSYNARRSFDNITLDPPILWTIDELCLVIGGGDPYVYEVIGRWPLAAEIDPPVAQPVLF